MALSPPLAFQPCSDVLPGDGTAGFGEGMARGDILFSESSPITAPPNKPIKCHHKHQTVFLPAEFLLNHCEPLNFEGTPPPNLTQNKPLTYLTYIKNINM